MVGPVFYQELLLGSRRGRGYIFRWIYAAWLVALVGFFAFLWWSESLWSLYPTYATADVGRRFTEFFVVQQFLLLLLATPVFTAGAVTDEKTSGTLQYLLTTDLHAFHILLGKLLGRAAQMVLLSLTGLPLLCFLGAFGGLEPLTVLGIGLVAVPQLLAVASVTVLASVWCRQTRDAVLGVYVVLLAAAGAGWLLHALGLAAGALAGAGVLAGFFGWLSAALQGLAQSYHGLLQGVQPLYVLDPIWAWPDRETLAEFGRRYLLLLAVCGGTAAVCFGLAVVRLRPAYIRQLEGEGRKKKDRWWRARRAAIGSEPVRWKERHVEGVAPLAALRRVPRWAGMLLIFLATAGLQTFVLFSAMKVPAARAWEALARLDLAEFSSYVAAPVDGAFFTTGVIAMLLASLVVGIRCSGAISGERERQTWEALLLTPLPAKHLIRGKLWGIIGASYPYLLAYAVPALALSALGGVEAFFWVVVLLAVTWLAVYFIGATGIRCSVRAKSSWRSLLGTVGIGYAGGTLLFCVASPVTFVVALLILIFLQLIDAYLRTSLGAAATAGGLGNFLTAFYIASCVTLALLFWLVAWYFVVDAQKWVAERERTRHWKEEWLEPVQSSRPRGRRAKSSYR